MPAHDLEEPLGGPGLGGADAANQCVQFVGERAAPSREFVGAGVGRQQIAVFGEAYGPVGVGARDRVGAVDAVLQQVLLAQPARVGEQLIDVGDRLVAAGGEVTPGSIEQFAALLARERVRYEKLIRDARIQPD